MPPSQPQTMTPAWKVWISEAGEVWSGGWARLWPRLWIILVACLIGAGLVLTISSTDISLQQMARVDDAPMAKDVARFFSRYGDLNLGGPLAVLIWVVGAVRDKVRWRKLGLACLMALLLSGFIVNIFRVGMGRPRPYAEQPNTELSDGFYGPHRSADYQSFPSGHATASSTTATTLAGAVPILVVPATLYALSVSWSRMQLDKHHPVDVTVGMVIGVLCGLCFASTVPGSGVCLRERKSKGKKHSKPATNASGSEVS